MEDYSFVLDINPTWMITPDHDSGHYDAKNETCVIPVKTELGYPVTTKLGAIGDQVDEYEAAMMWVYGDYGSVKKWVLV